MNFRAVSIQMDIAAGKRLPKNKNQPIMKKLILFLPVLLCCLLVAGFSGNTKKHIPIQEERERGAGLLMCPGIFEPVLNA